MEVISLNSANFIGLSSNYSPDSSLSFNQQIYYTEQGTAFPVSQALMLPNDSSTNNYSNLFLTSLQPLSSVVSINNLQPITDDGFTTYLALYSLNGINPSTSLFMNVQEPANAVSVANISLSSNVLSNIDNTYMFTIKFYSDVLCKVEHVNAYVTRYLTIGSDASLYFAFDTGTDYLGDRSPQLFNYTYDRINNCIVFSKRLQDISYTIANTSSGLAAIQISTGPYPYLPSSIWSCALRPQEPNDTLLYDPWVSYNKNTATNTQDINLSRTVSNINSNLLINSQYLSLTGTALDVNALSLKNTNTPENYQSRNNPFQANKSQFLSENEVEFRDYKRLFTGSNQALGNDNITMGYEAYTTDIVLPKDAVTYFHVPQIIYPFKEININDSGLIQAGAIAGDHPVKSDKIFKKLADAKYTSPFGSATDNELNGSFLCSWLSGSSDITVAPIWVDRYYNPSKVTFITALTTRSLHANTYSTVFDGFVQAAGTPPSTDEVFDVPSDLTFEPGCYYAYHHYGPSDVQKYIDIFTPYLIEQDFPNYYSSLSNSSLQQPLTNEYDFSDGTKYAITNSLSSIQDTNQFTMCFDLHNSDWSKPFGSQVIGNLLNDGFGIFNENINTPTIFVRSISGTSAGLTILNTDFTTLKSVIYPSTYQPLAYIRGRFGSNYSAIFSDNNVRQYSCDDKLLRQTYSPYLSTYTSYTNTDSTAYIICSGASQFTLLSLDLVSNIITRITNAQNFYYAPNTAGNNATTINYYNSGFYFTNGTISRRVNDTLYYLTDNNTSIIKWGKLGTSNTTTTTAFKISGTNTFVDFNIDYDGNIWIINSNNSYYKYTQNNVYLLSGTLTSNTQLTTTINLTGNGATTVVNLSTTATPNNIVININNSTLRQSFDYSLSGNRIVFSSPLVNGAIGNITYNTTQDTFSNYKVSFISEFNNGAYYTNTLFARTGYKTPPQTSTTPSISTQAYQFVYVDTNGNPLSSTIYYSATGVLSLTNTNYLREFVQGTYPASNLNIKAITTNIYNSADVSTSEIIYNLSALDPGYHHFAIRFDAYHGYMTLFIDAQVAGSVQFTPRKYKFSNLIYRPFLIGSACFNNSTPLYKYLKKNSYLTENIKIRNFYLYDTPLNDYDIIMHARQSRDIQDIHFDVSCGRRNYLEEIERYFKASLPGTKSTLYNTVIRNTGITDPGLQQSLEKTIARVLANSAPAFTKLNTVKWIN